MINKRVKNACVGQIHGSVSLSCRDYLLKEERRTHYVSLSDTKCNTAALNNTMIN